MRKANSRSWSWHNEFADRQDWHGVKGLSFKDAGGTHHEPERPVTNINDLPAPAYHLGNYDTYSKSSGTRRLGYASSVGCPYACNYCTDMVFYKRRFNAYRAERVVSDLADLVARYSIDEVAAVSIPISSSISNAPWRSRKESLRVAFAFVGISRPPQISCGR